MNDIIATKRDLQTWAAKQPYPVRRAADPVINGLGQWRDDGHPMVLRILSDDVAKLETVIAQVKG